MSAAGEGADLIVRLEAATEGSRDLDEQIALAAGLWSYWLSKHRYWNFEGPEGRRFHYPQDGLPRFDPETGREIDMNAIAPTGWADNAGLPEYTASIDAALSLAPAGAIVELNWKLGEPCYAGIETETHPVGCADATCATPALALVAAALKARTPLKARSRARAAGVREGR